MLDYKLSYTLMGAILGAWLAEAITIAVTMPMYSDDTNLFALLFASPVALIGGAIAGKYQALRVLAYLQLKGPDEGVWTRKKIMVVASLLIGTPISAYAIAIISTDYHHTPPSDAKLLANFQQHHATYVQLEQMAQADKGLSWVGTREEDSTNPMTSGVSWERIHQYQKLLAVANVQNGLVVTSDEGNLFMYWDIGTMLVDAGTTAKGYA